MPANYFKAEKANDNGSHDSGILLSPEPGVSSKSATSGVSGLMLTRGSSFCAGKVGSAARSSNVASFGVIGASRAMSGAGLGSESSKVASFGVSGASREISSNKWISMVIDSDFMMMVFGLPAKSKETVQARRAVMINAFVFMAF